MINLSILSFWTSRGKYYAMSLFFDSGLMDLEQFTLQSSGSTYLTNIRKTQTFEIQMVLNEHLESWAAGTSKFTMNRSSQCCWRAQRHCCTAASSSASPRLHEWRATSGISNKEMFIFTLRSFRKAKHRQMLCTFSLDLVFGMFMSAMPMMWQSCNWTLCRFACAVSRKYTNSMLRLLQNE